MSSRATGFLWLSQVIRAPRVINGLKNQWHCLAAGVVIEAVIMGASVYHCAGWRKRQNILLLPECLLTSWHIWKVTHGNRVKIEGYDNYNLRIYWTNQLKNFPLKSSINCYVK
jgi:hypothetical protein